MTQIALITGANKGIGYEIARGLAETGVTVLIGSRSAERGTTAATALREAGLDALHVVLDVTDADSIAAAAKSIEAQYGSLDILVNNAGIAIADGSGDPSEATVPTMRTIYETNVFGVVAVTNAMLPLLQAAPAARIVNISSDLGSLAWALDQSHPYWPLKFMAYASSKTALNMVTASYAKELWDTPIKVNAANPGYCATDLNGHSGFRTAEQGAQIAIKLALLDADGPTGAFLEDSGSVPW